MSRRTSPKRYDSAISNKKRRGAAWRVVNLEASDVCAFVVCMSVVVIFLTFCVASYLLVFVYLLVVVAVCHHFAFLSDCLHHLALLLL